MAKIVVRALFFVIFAATPGIPLDSDSPGTAGRELRSLELQIHRDVNEARRAARVSGLAWNRRLAVEARRHARNMASQLFFSHYDPARGHLADRLDKSGIAWSRCAENLYKGKGIREPAGEALKAWLSSAGHRKNMLDSRLSETGIGTALRQDGTLIIVQEFLSR